MDEFQERFDALLPLGPQRGKSFNISHFVGLDFIGLDFEQALSSEF